MNDNFSIVKKMIYEVSPKRAEEELNKRKKALKRNQVIQLLIAIGAKYWTDNNNNEATRVFKKIVSLRPNKDDKAEAYLYLGRIAIDKEEFFRGVTLFKKVLGLAKDRWLIASAYYGASSCYYSIPDREKSIYFAQKSLEYYDLTEDNQISYYYDSLERIIANYILMDKLEEANKIIDKVLSDERAPRQTISEIYYDLADYYYKLKQWGRAIENYNNALRYFDGSYLQTKGLILTYLASCYENVGDYPKAIANYKHSLEFLSELSDITFARDRLEVLDR